MDYRVAIPSYHRDQRIGEATLGLLARSNIDMERVSVFVNDDAEREKGFEALEASRRGRRGAGEEQHDAADEGHEGEHSGRDLFG